MKCRFCKNEIEDDSIFCRFCGERVARQRRKSAGEAREIRVPKPHQLTSGEYAAQVMIGGHRETVKGWTEAEYYEKARALKAGLLAVKEQHGPVTVGDAIDAYIAGRASELSPETVRGYQVIRRNRYPEIMQADAWTITDEDLSAAVKRAKKHVPVPKAKRQPDGLLGAYVTGEQGKKLVTGRTEEEYRARAELYKAGEEGLRPSAKTVKNDTALIKSAIYGVTKRRVDVKTPKVKRPKHDFLEPEQIQAFCEAARGDKVEIAALLALSSLRRSELVHLTWDKIDLKKRLIVVEGADVYGPDGKRISRDENKTEESARVVPIMMDQLHAALTAKKKDAGRVVTCAPDTVRRRINRLCKKAGLPEVGTHGMRHSFASLAAHLQMPIQVAQEIGGWSNDKIMKEIYTHVAQTDKNRFKNEMASFYNARR